jgi:acetyl esterase/lipase
VWAQGGGFTHGDLDQLEADMVSCELAVHADAIVVSVDYQASQSGHVLQGEI